MSILTYSTPQLINATISFYETTKAADAVAALKVPLERRRFLSIFPPPHFPMNRIFEYPTNSLLYPGITEAQSDLQARRQVERYQCHRPRAR